MDARFQYAWMKMALVKFIKDKDVYPESQNPTAEVVALVDADYSQQ